ncbi:hypothetical protein ACFQ1S_11960 [Kibdelosporangium lantanae]|uniref:Uncharacterized protein n=1 Tax=Kibdelosporangium lantanae TaxID=1497396 RepID=A0ABW3M8I4_9PSEU
MSTIIAAGWLETYLRDPAGALFAVLAEVREWVVNSGPLVFPIIVTIFAVLVIGRRWWLRRCHAQLTADARQITVLAPPIVDPAGGEALWANLVGLLRPRLAVRGNA